VVERYVAAVGASGSSLFFEGDRFVLLKHADRFQGAIANWILQQEAEKGK
jgi:hypothetical protein